MILERLRVKDGVILYEVMRGNGQINWQVKAFYLKKSWGTDLLTLIEDVKMRQAMIDYCNARIKEVIV